MPAKYEAIKRRLLAAGKTLADAKTSAARIFNATRKRGEAPVTRYHGLEHARRKKS